jgi:hypothetical protein
LVTHPTAIGPTVVVGIIQACDSRDDVTISNPGLSDPLQHGRREFDTHDTPHRRFTIPTHADAVADQEIPIGLVAADEDAAKCQKLV